MTGSTELGPVQPQQPDDDCAMLVSSPAAKPSRSRPTRRLEPTVQLTPVWEHVVKTGRFPERTDVTRVFLEIYDRLRDPEWEVRQHALRVLVSVLPTVDPRLIDRVAGVLLSELIENLGHPTPAVRKGSLDALRTYLIHSPERDKVTRKILREGIERSAILDAQQTNIATGVILSTPLILFPTSSASRPSEQVLREAIHSLASRLVQVVHQESALRSLAKIRDAIGEHDFLLHLAEFDPKTVRNFELLCDVYNVGALRRPSSASEASSALTLGAVEDSARLEAEEKPWDSASESSGLGNLDDADEEEAEPGVEPDEDDLEFAEARKTPRRVRFGGEVVKPRTPDSSEDTESLLSQEQPPPAPAIVLTRIPLPVSPATRMPAARLLQRRQTGRRSASHPLDQRRPRDQHRRSSSSSPEGRGRRRRRRDVHVHDGTLSPKKGILSRSRFQDGWVEEGRGSAFSPLEDSLMMRSSEAFRVFEDDLPVEDEDEEEEEDDDEDEEASPRRSPSLGIVLGAPVRPDQDALEQALGDWSQSDKLRKELENAAISSSASSDASSTSSNRRRSRSAGQTSLLQNEDGNGLTRRHHSARIPGYEVFPRQERNYILMELESYRSRKARESSTDDGSAVTVTVGASESQNDDNGRRQSDDAVNDGEIVGQSIDHSSHQPRVAPEDDEYCRVALDDDNHRDNEPENVNSSDLENICEEMDRRNKYPDWEELGLVNEEVLTDFHNKEDWRARVRGLERIASALRSESALSSVEPRLDSLLLAVLGGERSCRVAAAGMSVAKVLLSGVSEEALRSRMPLIAWGLARQAGPNAATLARLVMLRTSPGIFVESLLQPKCIGSRSAKMRENTLQLLMFCLVTFPSTEFKVDVAIRKVVASVNDRRKRVRHAALEALAVLGQIYDSEDILRASKAMNVGKPEGGREMTSAIKMRLSRKLLPTVSADGLVVYGLQLTSNSSVTGADVNWILSGSGSISPGTGRPRNQLTEMANGPKADTIESNKVPETKNEYRNIYEEAHDRLLQEQERIASWKMLPQSEKKDGSRIPLIKTKSIERLSRSADSYSDDNRVDFYNRKNSDISEYAIEKDNQNQRPYATPKRTERITVINIESSSSNQNDDQDNSSQVQSESTISQPLKLERPSVLPVRSESRIPVLTRDRTPTSREPSLGRESTMDRDHRMTITLKRDSDNNNYRASRLSHHRQDLDEKGIINERLRVKNINAAGPESANMNNMIPGVQNGFRRSRIEYSIEYLDKELQKLKEQYSNFHHSKLLHESKENQQQGGRRGSSYEKLNKPLAPEAKSTKLKNHPSNAPSNTLDQLHPQHAHNHHQHHHYQAHGNKGKHHHEYEEYFEEELEEEEFETIYQRQNRGKAEKLRQAYDMTPSPVQLTSEYLPPPKKSQSTVTRRNSYHHHHPENLVPSSYRLPKPGQNSTNLPKNLHHHQSPVNEPRRTSFHDWSSNSTATRKEPLSESGGEPSWGRSPTPDLEHQHRQAHHHYQEHPRSQTAIPVIQDLRSPSSPAHVLGNVRSSSCSSTSPAFSASNQSFGSTRSTDQLLALQTPQHHQHQRQHQPRSPIEESDESAELRNCTGSIHEDNSGNSTNTTSSPASARNFHSASLLQQQRTELVVDGVGLHGSPEWNRTRTPTPSSQNHVYEHLRQEDTFSNGSVESSGSQRPHTGSHRGLPDSRSGSSQSRHQQPHHGGLGYLDERPGERFDQALQDQRESTSSCSSREPERRSSPSAGNECCPGSPVKSVSLAVRAVIPLADDDSSDKATTESTTGSSSYHYANGHTSPVKFGAERHEDDLVSPELMGCADSKAKGDKGLAPSPNSSEELRKSVPKISPARSKQKLNQQRPSPAPMSKTDRTKLIQQCFNQLDSKEWEEQMRGLTALTQIAKEHPAILDACAPGVLARTLGRQIKSLRSQVARAACTASCEIFKALVRGIDQDLEEIAGPLLHRTSDTNKFIRKDCNAALDCMIQHFRPAKSIVTIANKGASHQNAITRATTARLLRDLVRQLEPEGVDALPKDVRDKLYAASAKLLTDGNLEARNFAKDTFRELSECESYRRCLAEAVPEATLRNIEKTLRTISHHGAADAAITARRVYNNNHYSR